MKVASLDLGSNTFLMLIAEVAGGRIQKILRNELRVTRLAEGVHTTGKLQPQALIRAEECLHEYAKIIAIEKPQKVVAMATSAARDAVNREDLFEIGDRCGIEIQIIPGSLEAKISFLGSTFDMPSKNQVLTIDVGGGSTEVVFGVGEKDISGISVNIGSVRLTELFVTAHPIGKSEIESMQAYIKNELKALADFKKHTIKQMVAVAGTATTLASVAQGAPYSSESVHGYLLSRSDLRAWRDKMAALTLDERKSLRGMDPRRADVIVTGATILLMLTDYFNIDSLTVSDRGVRFGIALMAERGEL